MKHPIIGILAVCLSAISFSATGAPPQPTTIDEFAAFFPKIDQEIRAAKEAKNGLIEDQLSSLRLKTHCSFNGREVSSDKWVLQAIENDVSTAYHLIMRHPAIENGAKIAIVFDAKHAQDNGYLQQISSLKVGTRIAFSGKLHTHKDLCSTGALTFDILDPAEVEEAQIDLSAVGGAKRHQLYTPAMLSKAYATKRASDIAGACSDPTLQAEAKEFAIRDMAERYDAISKAKRKFDGAFDYTKSSENPPKPSGQVALTPSEIEGFYRKPDRIEVKPRLVQEHLCSYLASFVSGGKKLEIEITTSPQQRKFSSSRVKLLKRVDQD